MATPTDYADMFVDGSLEFPIRESETVAGLRYAGTLSVSTTWSADRSLSALSEPWSIIDYAARNDGGGSGGTSVVFRGRFNQGFN